MFRGMNTLEQQALLNDWAAIVTVDGTRPPSPLARDTFEALATQVLGLRPGTPFPASTVTRTACAAPMFAHLAIAAVIDPLEPARLAVLRRVMEVNGIEAPIVDDLDAFASGQRLAPRLRATARMLQARFGLSLSGLVLSTIRMQLASRPAIAARYRSLAALPPGTLGAELLRYYAENGIPVPGERGSYPYEAVGVHDVCHVLGGYTTTNRGELLVSAFEAGAAPIPWADYLVPGMLHCHLGIPFEPGTESSVGLFDPQAFYRAFARGAASSVMTDPSWDFFPMLALPIAEARERLGIAGRGEVGSASDPWCGTEGPIYERTHH